MLAEEIKQNTELKADKQKELFKRVEKLIKSYANHSQYAVLSLSELSGWLYHLDLYKDSPNNEIWTINEHMHYNEIWTINEHMHLVKDFLETEGFKTELCWSLNNIALKIIW